MSNCPAVGGKTLPGLAICLQCCRTQLNRFCSLVIILCSSSRAHTIDACSTQLLNLKLPSTYCSNVAASAPPVSCDAADQILSQPVPLTR